MTLVVLGWNNGRADKGFLPENGIKNPGFVIFNPAVVLKYPADAIFNPAVMIFNPADALNNPADGLQWRRMH
jgi:hypothetical protein